MSKRGSNGSRRKARAAAMQALYQWQFQHHDLHEIVEQFSSDPEYKSADLNYFEHIIKGAIQDVGALDALIEGQIDRSLSQLTPVELATLRLAVFELKHCLGVPYRVVINEALEVAKIFGADQSYKYINAVLDKLAPKLRSAEMS